MRRLLRVGVLVSGRGSNLQAILDAIDGGRLDAEVAVVIANALGCPALEKASSAGVPTECVTSRSAGGRKEQLLEIHRALLRHAVDVVVLAGFNLILDPETTSEFKNRIVNIHPSLLPAFAGGMAPQPQADAVEYGVKVSGCTVHLVTDDLDGGAIVAQVAVPVRFEDTAETLADRILQEEHKILPEVLQWMAEDRVRVFGRRVQVLPEGVGDGPDGGV